MLDDEMDHIIREAAENHHPPYNDMAWDKMEQQLDKHLPQKKDRRRFVFFVLFFLLLGGSTFFVLNNRLANNKIVATNKSADKKVKDNTDDATTDQLAAINEKQEPATIPVVINNNEPSQNNLQTGNKAETPQKRSSLQSNAVENNHDLSNDLTDANDEIRTNRTNSNVVKPKLLKVQNTNKYQIANVLTKADEIDKSSEQNKKNKKATGSRFKTKTKIGTANQFEEIETETDGGLTNAGKRIKGEVGSKMKVDITTPDTEDAKEASTASNLFEEINKKPADLELKTDKEKDSVKTATAKKVIATNKPDKKKAENKFSNNFGLTFSIGPDLSFVKLNDAGRTTLTFGAGLSYDFAKRFTARAGFYASKKIYRASPDEYHNTIYPNLTSVDANCKVFEMPISVSYNFGMRNKHNWFGSVGLSSYIMKTEDYTYNYKTAGGQTYTYYNKISNQNKHYFSVLNLSGGYKYQLSNRLSLQAEPYLQVPLGGVGFGKIKLNSAGVLFTVTYKPFKKKK